MSAALALRAAIRQRLAADMTLQGVLGGPKVYDEVPLQALAPYVVLDAIESRDAGAVDLEAEEHLLTLNVWSRQAGMSEALWTAARVAFLLGRDDGISLTGYRLSNMSWLATDAKRSTDGRHRMAAIRFRAMTETAAA